MIFQITSLTMWGIKIATSKKIQIESGFASQLQLVDIKTNPSRFTTSKPMFDMTI